jgi:DNA-binding IclR family transcriptional regulator
MQTSGSNSETSTVVRAFRLLELFSTDHPQLSLSMLTSRLGFSKATTHRLAQTLVSIGCLEQDEETRTYRLGLPFIRLGQVASASSDVRSRALSQMSELRERFGETIYLLVPRAHRSVCIERIEGTRPIRDSSATPGDAFPLFVGAGGIAMLSTMAAAVRDEILDTAEMSAEERRTIETQLAEAAVRGYATAAGDVSHGAGAVAAPIFDHHGDLAGAISLGAARQQILDRHDEFGRAVCEAAARTSVLTKTGHGE